MILKERLTYIKNNIEEDIKIYNLKIEGFQRDIERAVDYINSYKNELQKVQLELREINKLLGEENAD